ncbi:MAG: MOSC N-terminal beta barrel domain-containing protein [Flavobacteriales bacterium]|nr:MOSC N-terminal beta barrel domain-containing protein [Flavobacteriales bacterium]
MTRKIDHLFVYPVKSLGGFGVNQAAITAQGFEFDRRFMLIDENNRFISQRK